jgi:hypothetical protein
VDRYDGPEADVIVVAENDLLMSGFLAGIEEFHDVASLVLFFGNAACSAANESWCAAQEKIFTFSF